MFAVIKTGGKQYRLEKGDVVRVEKLEAEVGQPLTIDHVMMVGEGDKVSVGVPVVEGASVTFDVLETRKDDKIVVFKKHRRQNYRRKKGHRQWLTVLRVTDIIVGGQEGAKKATAEKATVKKASSAKTEKATTETSE